jgi:hypothetical protein
MSQKSQACESRDLELLNVSNNLGEQQKWFAKLRCRFGSTAP